MRVTVMLFAGTLFVNRVLTTKRRAAKFSHSIYLQEAFRDDIQWWLEALQVRNGVSFLVQDATVKISLDASSNGWANGAPSIGAYHHGLHEYISVSPPPELHDLHISDLELLGDLLVARVWGPQMVHQHICILTDSECCLFLIKKEDRHMTTGCVWLDYTSHTRSSTTTGPSRSGSVPRITGWPTPSL